MGGIGNQLFQYSLYCRLKENYPNYDIYANTVFYKEIGCHTGFELAGYVEENNELIENGIIITEINYDRYCIEAELDSRHNYIFNGYWQDRRFFPHHMTEILGVIGLDSIDVSNSGVLKKILEEDNSVSIHVRRGDYVNNPFHGNIATVHYYNNAIKEIKKRVECPYYFIFSDDFEWCRTKLCVDGNRVCYVEENAHHPSRDILLMSKCHHNVIANSSFSWWGQELNQHSDKMVFTPEYWFNDNNSAQGEGLIDDSLIHVSNLPVCVKRNTSAFFSVIIVNGDNPARNRRCKASILNQLSDLFEIFDISEEQLFVEKWREQFDELIKKLNGEYVIFVNSNDYLSEDVFELIKNRMCMNAVMNNIIGFSYMKEPEQICYPFDYQKYDVYQRYILSLNDGNVIHYNCAYSKEFLMNGSIGSNNKNNIICMNDIILIHSEDGYFNKRKDSSTIYSVMKRIANFVRR